MNTFWYYFNYLDSIYTGYPLIIRITVFLTMFLIIVYLITLITIFYMSLKRRQYRRRRREIVAEFETAFNSIICSPKRISAVSEMNLGQIRPDQLEKWQKFGITRLLLEIKEANPIDFNEHNFDLLLEQFNLPNFWEQQVVGNGDKETQEAMRVINDCEDKSNGNAIKRIAQNNNPKLTKYAKSSYIKLSTTDGLTFLENDFDQNFNDLDKLRIHNSFVRRENEGTLPLLLRWVVTSKTEAYKAFLINEIGFFQQQHNAKILLDIFINTESELIRAQIAKTLGLLNYEPAVKFFTNNFVFQTTKVQEEIFYYLGRIGTREALEFLEEQFKLTHDSELLIDIIRNIYRIDQDNKEVYNRLKAASTSNFSKSAFSYVENEEVIMNS